MFNIIVDDEEYKIIQNLFISFSGMDIICDACGYTRKDGYIEIRETPGRFFEIQCINCGNFIKIFTVHKESEAAEYLRTLVSRKCAFCFYSYPENNDDKQCKGEHCDYTMTHPSDCKCTMCIGVLVPE